MQIVEFFKATAACTLISMSIVAFSFGIDSAIVLILGTSSFHDIPAWINSATSVFLLLSGMWVAVGVVVVDARSMYAAAFITLVVWTYAGYVFHQAMLHPKLF